MLTERVNGAPAWWHQISSASTRCQCDRSPAHSRNEMTVLAGRSPGAAGARHVSTYHPPSGCAARPSRSISSLRHRIHARRSYGPAARWRGARGTAKCGRTGVHRSATPTIGPRTPYGIRTRVTCVKGRRPRPLDERGVLENGGADDTSSGGGRLTASRVGRRRPIRPPPRTRRRTNRTTGLVSPSPWRRVAPRLTEPA